MPSRDIIAGISISDDIASLAVLEHRPEEIELLFLDEHRRTDNTEYWYLNPLEQLLGGRRVKINQVAVALDPTVLTIVSCPLDASLTLAERNEHVHWELSQYIKNYQPNDYVNDVHILETHSQLQIQYVLAVAVRRNVIFGLQSALRERGVMLGIVDVNHFTTVHSLLRSHPETTKGVCACIGISGSRVDASILRNGYMVFYRYNTAMILEEIRSFFEEVLSQPSLSGVYLHGIQSMKDHEKLLKSLTQLPIIVLNPLRKILISHDFPAFTHLMPYTHHFAAAVGIALRKS